jgi:hypothetical protein
MPSLVRYAWCLMGSEIFMYAGVDKGDLHPCGRGGVGEELKWLEVRVGRFEPPGGAALS